MLSIIVAIASNYAIGRHGELLCHMPADLLHFKQITMHHPVIMGERTFLSLPKRPLPGRRNIVISDNPAFVAEGCEVAHSIEQAIALVEQENEAFVIGGGMVYKQMMPLADKLYITHIHHQWDDADTFFPIISPTQWRLTDEEHHSADLNNPYDYTYAEYLRILEPINEPIRL